MKKTIFAIMMLVLLLCSCSNTKITLDEGKKAPANHETKWTMLIYASGDNGGRTSAIIEALTKEEYPENINVIVQTGGSHDWALKGINGDYIQRFLMQKNTAYLKDQKQGASMGHYQTLTDFVTWGMDTFPADNYMLFMLGDGNGFEMCSDELYNGDSLDIEELYYALSMVPDTIDAICFDASHMASLEVATSLPNYAKYMVASQEKFTGFNYEEIVNCIKEYPMAQVREVCDQMCKTYDAENIQDKSRPLSQLSLIDLSQIAHLNQLFDALSLKLDAATYSFADTASLIRLLEVSERCVDSNMVDLGSFAMAASEYCGESSYHVIDAINASVLYNVKGSLRNEASGISICYPKADTLPDSYLKATISDNYTIFLKKILPAFTAEDSQIHASARDTRAYKEYEETELLISTQTTGDVYAATIESGLPALKNAKVKRFFNRDGKTLSCGETQELDCFWEEARYQLMLSSKMPLLKGEFLDAKYTSHDSGYSIYSAEILLDDKNAQLYMAYSPQEDKYIYIGVWDGHTYVQDDALGKITPVYTDKASGQKVFGKEISAGSSLGIKTQKIPNDVFLEFEAEDIYRKVYH